MAVPVRLPAFSGPKTPLYAFSHRSEPELQLDIGPSPPRRDTLLRMRKIDPIQGDRFAFYPTGVSSQSPKITSLATPITSFPDSAVQPKSLYL